MSKLEMLENPKEEKTFRGGFKIDVEQLRRLREQMEIVEEEMIRNAGMQYFRRSYAVNQQGVSGTSDDSQPTHYRTNTTNPIHYHWTEYRQDDNE